MFIVTLKWNTFNVNVVSISVVVLCGA